MKAEAMSTDFQYVYEWIDEIPLSRPKKNIARDFSDGVLLSEVVKHFFPSKVDLHNYISTNSMSKKTVNWNTLNKKVLKKYLGYEISPDEIKALVSGKKGAIEKTLENLRIKIEARKKRMEEKKGSRRKSNTKPTGMVRTSPHASPMQGHIRPVGIPPSMQAMLGEKDNVIEDLRETVAILQMKVQKLEQLLRLKDRKLEQLQSGQR